MSLPDYVKNKPLKVQEKWKSIKKDYSKDSVAVGLGVANKWLASYTPEVTQESLVFTADKEQITMRSIGNVNYVDFMLADTRYDSYGTKYTESFLQKIVTLFNSGKVSLSGDFNHDTLKKLQDNGYSKGFIKSKLGKLKQGIAKAIKAIYENGKLYLRTVVDPEYKERVMNSKGVSIEGSFVKEGDTFIDGTILGFSFIDSNDKELGNPRAKILK